MDDLDRAKEQETQHRKQSLAAQLATPDHSPGEKPIILGDEICCIDCYYPIPEKRLEAKPDAVRCVDCKEVWEKKNR